MKHPASQKPVSDTSAASAAVPLTPLRNYVRLLGRTLGEVIHECEGRDTYNVIERLRQVAVRLRREGARRDSRAEKSRGRGSAGKTSSVMARFAPSAGEWPAHALRRGRAKAGQQTG